MRFFNIFATVLPMFFIQFAVAQDEDSDVFYGEVFEVQQNQYGIQSVYRELLPKDTVQTQLVGKIKEVCQAKGCWMKVTMENSEEVFVRFKDYGFFVPKNSASKDVVVNGMAFLEEMSVEDQKHYARDRGASSEEIAQIKAPKKILRLEADGVLIRNEN
ncbi:DUF4920 domain-containing protein [Muricauda sp. JGD-17]|uniref:DUF4920 domain-containing protein n=1 Tax=Flagellimonas ochracea TaxID=2696472 RepID=A0A964WW80_9FLAO|nr:DUF4920 domain-containing protein [Allomuricauda ochracea]NAY90324.1 DUF4920 domain-containing protein [Allomuricauda ochracea]